MNSFMRNLRIGTLGMAMVVLLVITAGLVVASSFLTMRSVTSITETWVDYEKGPAQKVAILNDMSSALGYGGMIHQLKNFVLRQDRPRIVKIQRKIREVTVALVSYQALGVSASEKAALAQIGTVVAEYADAVALVERLASEGKSASEIDALVKISDKPALAGLSALNAEMQSAIEASSRGVYDTAGAASALVRTAGIVTGGLLALLVAGFFWFTRWRLVLPLTQITGAMSKLAEGDLGTEIPGLDKGDEIGEMAQATQVFKDNAIERERLEAEAKQAAVEVEARAKRTAELCTAFDKAVTAVLDTVASSATELQTTAQSMSSTAEQTASQATAVAAASEQATSNVQTVSAAAEELSSSVTEIGRQVAQSSAITKRAVEEAEHTNSSVQGLAEAGQKIGDVVKMITDIAEQTNLLALNATIEAARAGDAGKGFAVVASEVKSLANQTAQATEDIAIQISGMQSVTDDVVKAIEGIGATISEVNDIATTIAAAVEEQGAATQEIARNVQQAANGTQEVSSNIEGVNQAASETGSAANQVLQAAGELSEQSETLRGEVDKFLAEVRAA